MKSSKSIVLGLALGISTFAQAQTCSSSQGINLSQGSGSFVNLPARDQGQLGTCYAHAGSDLISSYLKIGRINIFQTAVANDTSVEGGGPDDVINSFASLGWACTDVTLFKNLFPSVSKNIIGELQDTFIGTPIFYTINANAKAGIERQKRIALKAAEMARGKVHTTGILAQHDQGLKNYHAINKQIKGLEDQIKKLEKEKSWFSSNTEINNKIAQLNKQIAVLREKAKVEHGKYTASLTKLNGGNRLDSFSEDEAAEIVYYLIGKQHVQFASIMKRYGLTAPSLADFIVDRVHYDPVKHYSYAGVMYPYKVIKKVMENACPAYAKTKIPSNIKGMSMSKSKVGVQAFQDKIESLLERSRQAVSVSFPSSMLTGTKGENHAVNIIGCRTNGRLTEYLLQNSWGQGCSSYKESLRSKCQQGRVWVPADQLMSNAYEINWIEKKK